MKGDQPFGTGYSRRDFVAAALGGVAAAALPRPLVAAFRRAAFHEVRRGVGYFTGRGGTIGYLLNSAGTVVVDSQFPDQARELIAGLRERGASAVDALVNTHHHGDHTAGNTAFGGVARRIVAQEGVPALQRRAAEQNPNAPAQAYPDTTFEREWSLEIGDEAVRAKHYGPAHTGADATVFFRAADVVHMGDLVFHGAYPFIDRAGGASVRGWIEVLEAIAAEHSADTIYLFGHAAPELPLTGDRGDVLAFRDLLAAVLDAAREAHDRGMSREEATARQTLPGFEHIVALAERLSLGATIGVAYDELAEGGAG